MDEHTATTEIAKQSQECPVFQKGCPYAKNETFDISAIKKHAAFANGCPYKNVDVHKLQECPAFKDHQCPFDGNHKFNMEKVHECPAFKAGCPYANLEHPIHNHSKLSERDASQHIAVAASKCPVFAHSNCPFDPQHPHALDMSKVTLCPAFQRTGGQCPFKDVKVERLHECPAFKDGKCPFDGSAPIDMSRIKECPAFQKGCPYSHLHSENEHTVVVHVSQEAKKCPIFAQKNGGCPYDPEHLRSIDMSKAKECPEFHRNGEFQCPYKNMKLEKLHECPAFKDGKCPFDKAGPIDLSKLKECPAFKSGCPYKEIEAQPAATATTTTTTTTTTATTPAAPATAATTPAAPAGHPQGDPAKCPFASMHSKLNNPHQ